MKFKKYDSILKHKKKGNYRLILDGTYTHVCIDYDGFFKVIGKQYEVQKVR